MTTHSPQILSHVRPESIWLLERDDLDTVARHPEDSYGRESNRILEDLMGVPSRPSGVKEQLNRLFQTIDLGDLDDAGQLAASIKDNIGDDPELAKARVLMRRKRVIGK